MRTKKYRFIYMFLVGILISLIIKLLVPFENPNHIYLYDALSSIFITILIWEGSLRIDSYLNKKLSWVEKTLKRILYQFLITLIFSSVCIYFPMLSFNKFVCFLPPEKENILIIISIIIGVLVSFIILTIEISAQFFSNWKTSLLEVEKYKTASIEAQLKNLKDQVNPHFLFNNLSVLSSLVYSDQDKAADFIHQLAKVYRYVLENQENELVTLSKELDFIESYIFLLKIRFDSNLNVEFSIENCDKSLLLPPMCLQLLVENCIKHNEISEDKPLTIQIKCNNSYLLVSNNLQFRLDKEESSNKGINNIKSRYKHFTDKTIIINENEFKFEVQIPLLKFMK